MRTAYTPHPRLLLCASAAHCAQVLQAAAAARVHLHGVQPSLEWPADAQVEGMVVLWALLPTQCAAAAAATEHAWRERLRLGHHAFSVQMLYGSAQQQAAQLAPWIPQAAERNADKTDAPCWECLDAVSEQKLFQHLLQRP